MCKCFKLGEHNVFEFDTPYSFGMDDHAELTYVLDTNMACAEEEGGAIDIVFLDPDENINDIVLCHDYKETTKTLFLRNEGNSSQVTSIQIR